MKDNLTRVEWRVKQEVTDSGYILKICNLQNLLIEGSTCKRNVSRIFGFIINEDAQREE